MKNFFINIAALACALAIAVGAGLWIRNGKKVDTAIYYYKAYDQELTFGYGKQKDKDVGALVTNLDELKNLCKEYENPAFDKSSKYYSDAVPTKLREYDDRFFEKKDLIIFMRSGKVYYNKYLENLYVKDDYLVLRAYCGSPDGVEAQSCWLTFLVVDKKDVGSATRIIWQNLGSTRWFAQITA